MWGGLRMKYFTAPDNSFLEYSRTEWFTDGAPFNTTCNTCGKSIRVGDYLEIVEHKGPNDSFCCSPKCVTTLLAMGNVEANWDKDFEQQLDSEEEVDDRPKCQCPISSMNEPLRDGKCPKCGGV